VIRPATHPSDVVVLEYHGGGQDGFKEVELEIEEWEILKARIVSDHKLVMPPDTERLQRQLERTSGRAEAYLDLIRILMTNKDGL
jgi:hypothetical protein